MLKVIKFTTELLAIELVATSLSQPSMSVTPSKRQECRKVGRVEMGLPPSSLILLELASGWPPSPGNHLNPGGGIAAEIRDHSCS